MGPQSSVIYSFIRNGSRTTTLNTATSAFEAVGTKVVQTYVLSFTPVGMDDRSVGVASGEDDRKKLCDCQLSLSQPFRQLARSVRTYLQYSKNSCT